MSDFLSILGRDEPTEELRRILSGISKTLAYFDVKIAQASGWERDSLSRAKNGYYASFYQIQEYIIDRCVNVAPLSFAMTIDKDGNMTHVDQQMRPVDPEDKEQCQELYAAWDHCHRKAIQQLLDEEMAAELEDWSMKAEEMAKATGW